jgi:hypothetical protein
MGNNPDLDSTGISPSSGGVDATGILLLLSHYKAGLMYKRVLIQSPYQPLASFSCTTLPLDTENEDAAMLEKW